MKKVGQKRKTPKIKKIIIVGIFLVLSSLVIWKVVKYFQPVYKIETRLKKVEKAKQKNKEPIIGWIRVEGTNIDYPIVDASDTNKIDVSRILYDFAWTNKDSEKLGNREFLFGHNIINVSKHPMLNNDSLSRFEQLVSFMYYDFAKENQYIQYTYHGKEYLYKIFAVGFIEDDDVDYYNKNYTKKELKKYIETAKKDSFYNYDIEVDENDDILSLITCTRFYGTEKHIDFKVEARRVRENERVSRYNLAESKKYDKIKEEMEKEEEEDNEEV